MKKIRVIMCLAVITCFLCACGNAGTKEHIKTGEEIAVEKMEDASEAVEQNNEAVRQLQDQVDSIDDAEQ